MASKANQVTEAEIGIAALRIAAEQTDGIASLKLLKEKLPTFLNLSEEDQAQSTTRPNEEMWEQRVRNLISHRETPGNIIGEGRAEHLPKEGIRITEAGRSYLKGKGLS